MTEPTTRGGPAWPIVARREMLVRLTDKTFLVSTAFTVLLIVAALGAQVFLGGRTHTYDLATTSQSASMADSVVDLAPQGDAKTRVRLVPVADAAAARAALRDGDADAWLTRSGGGWRLVGQQSVDGQLESVVTQSVQRAVVGANAADAGTSYAALQQGSTVTIDQVEGDPQRSQLAQGLSFAMTLLFYLATLLFGIALAQSVVEEKQSRLVEIIVTSIPVSQLLAGKVLGNTVLALGQVVLYALIGLVGLSFTDYAAALPALSGGIGWFLVFFAVGFVLIATVYAVTGALASRTEDVQSTSTPATMLVMATFFASVLADGPARVVLSYLPPVSALLMPTRVVSGEAQWWEPLVALALLLGTSLLVVRVAARLYRRSLLQTGGKVGLRQAWTLRA